MNIYLPRDLEKFIESEIESGKCFTSSEVVVNALYHLKYSRLSDDEKLKELRQEIQKGIDSEHRDADEVMDELKARFK